MAIGSKTDRGYLPTIPIPGLPGTDKMIQGPPKSVPKPPPVKPSGGKNNGK
jgi:hypothetical protein